MINADILNNGQIDVYGTAVTDSARSEKIHFNFPESWNGYVKKAIFKNGEKTVGVFLNADETMCNGEDECFIPHEVIKAPQFTVSVFGVSGDSRVTSAEAVIKVTESGYTKGDFPLNPTPSEYEQLLNIAAETKQIARSVRIDADNGNFKGEKGDKGPQGEKGEKGEQGIQGIKGEKGDKGEKGSPFTYEDFTAEQLAALKGDKGDKGDPGVVENIEQFFDATSENAQSGRAVAEAVAPLSEQISKYSKTPQDVVVNEGYYWTFPQSSASYNYVHLDVREGDIITGEARNYGRYDLRFIDAYNGNTRVASACINSNTKEFIVPSEVDNIYVSYTASYTSKIIFYIQRTVEKTAVKGMKGLRDYVFKNGVWSATADTLSANTDLVIAPQIDNKKNCTYDGYAQFGTFTSFTLAHGKTLFQSSYLVVDATHIKTYHHNGSSAVLMDSYEHGLTFNGYISVHIDLKHSNRGSVTLKTNGGEFTQSNAYFGGCNGEITLSGGQDMTNVKGSYFLRDIYADTWIFGDSYISIGDTSKYPQHLINAGYTDYLLCGYGGAGSMNAVNSFRNLIEKCSPKRICWFLGMNDKDTETAVNANWKNVYDEIIGVCSSKNVELILATIPNVPNIRHDYKNDIIRASGYRYVDFAKAVNAEAVGSAWYDGMLSSDNVHPTQEGAKALAGRILLDVPEIAV